MRDRQNLSCLARNGTGKTYLIDIILGRIEASASVRVRFDGSLAKRQQTFELLQHYLRDSILHPSLVGPQKLRLDSG